MTWKSRSPWALVTPVTGVPLLPIETDQLHKWNIHLSIGTAASFSKTKGALSRWIWICWLADLRHRNKRDSVHSSTLVCQKTPQQWAEISSALPAVSWAAPLCFRWDPEVIHTEPAQPLLSSGAKGRAGILLGGALGSWLLPTPGRCQLPATVHRGEPGPHPGERQVKNLSGGSIRGIALLCPVRHYMLEHTLLGDKEDTHLFSSAGLRNHLGRIFLIENQNIPWCLTNLQIEKSASARAARRQEKDLYTLKHFFFSPNIP